MSIIESQENYRLRKQKLVDDSKTPCLKCGCDKKHVIDFHHINYYEKSFEISRGIREKGFAKLIEEIGKCVSLCSNCHREFHYFYGQETTAEELEEYLTSNEV